MFRIVFKSLAPQTRMLDIQYGPWHPTRDVAEYWVSYFQSLGHCADMLIEERTNGSLSSSAGLTHVS